MTATRVNDSSQKGVGGEKDIGREGVQLQRLIGREDPTVVVCYEFLVSVHSRSPEFKRVFDIVAQSIIELAARQRRGGSSVRPGLGNLAS